MSNQDWTSKLQDQLAGYQESVSHDLWAGIEQSLAQKNIESVSTNPQTIVSENSESIDLHVGSEVQKNARVLHDSSEAKKNARIVYFKRWSAAAAAVALLGIGGSYVYLHQEDVERGNLQLASLSSPAVSADLHSAASQPAPSHVVSADLQSAASQPAPSPVVSADLQSAASQKKTSDVLKEESENEISLLAEKSDYKALTRSADHHAAAYASQSYHFEKMRRFLAGRCSSMPKT